MTELHGKNVVVTGASRGIGVFIARALAARGANLALLARDAAALERVASELRSRVRAVPVAVDLKQTANYPVLLDRIERELGPIDVLVNNAAIESNYSFAECPPDYIAELIQVDLTAPMLLSRALLPRLLAKKSGHIVNVASLAGKSPTAYNVTYSAAKSGLILFSQSLRAELHGTGVSVSVVSPGFVRDEGMFAAKMTAASVRVPKVVGTSEPAQVARGVIEALERDCVEVIVSPGPMRLLNALTQLSPSLMISMLRRLGIPEIFRKAGIAQNEPASVTSPMNGAGHPAP